MHHDAVGNFCRQVAALLQDAGHPVQLWAENSNVEVPLKVSDRSGFWDAVKADDVIFFNHSIHDPVVQRIAALPQRKVAYFHNVTPPELIEQSDVATVENCRLGLLERGVLGSFDVILANTEASASILLDGMTESDAVKHAGRIIVCPPLVGADRWSALEAETLAPSRALVKILFVGRLVPHKGVREVMEIAAALADHFSSVELNIVGGPAGGSYVEALKEQARTLGELTSTRVVIRHGISDGELKALYQDTTICLVHSTHEGFCIPALDALAFDKPIFVTPVPAVLEVLGKAALVIPKEDRATSASKIVAFLQDSKYCTSHGELRRARFAELKCLSDGGLIVQALQRTPA